MLKVVDQEQNLIGSNSIHQASLHFAAPSWSEIERLRDSAWDKLGFLYGSQVDECRAPSEFA
jgi:hypothetical protein